MFTFDGYEIKKEEGIILFKYILQHENETFTFFEKISVDPTKAQWQKVPAATFETLSLILGISYWKLFCPKELKLSHLTLSQEQAEFWNKVYTKGLGEFFYRNGIDFRGMVNFPSSFQSKFTSPRRYATDPLLSQERGTPALILWGGGKDSIVTAELLKKDGKDFDIFTLNTSSVQEETAAVLGKKPIAIARKIDPLLLDLNKRPDAYNGHVPVTFIYSAIALLAALLYGYDAVITSCEESANYGNVEYLGEQINHQWSKSFEFEKMLREYIQKYITADVTYVSLLRPYSELQIVEMFSRYSQYFSSFSSCNKNFTIAKTAKSKWCGQCAKCAFVFALMAAYIPKEKVLEIFGKNLFADAALLTIYRKLLGLEAEKPFDCVGTPEETQKAFTLARARGGYEDDVIMKEYTANFKK